MTKSSAINKALPQLPGHFVRIEILKPKKMSVTEAAQILGVGRPAFSKFLNGNASLSSDMAARIEHAFAVPAQKLLDMQAAYDAAQAKNKGVPTNTKTYVPPFLQIKANEIEAWATSDLRARARLAVLLRTLIHSTGIELSKVDFPGNDDAERHGWDGQTTASIGTAWIPKGQAGWEFGCNQDPQSKADDDYSARTKSINKSEREKTIFVFVTPQRWKNKATWQADRKAENQWRDVLVIDSSDLEQWIEQSIPAQSWFARETQRISDGTRSLDKCWIDWAHVADPALPEALLKPAAEKAKASILSILAKKPEEPIIIAADSTEEATAFLSVLFSQDFEELASYRDRVIIFDKPGILPKLATGHSNFIAVATTREVEREMASLCHSIHTIAVYPRNSINTDPHVLLEPLNYEAFRSALETVGYARDFIDRLGDDSGRSLTVLRRLLSKVLAVRTPEWVDNEKASILIPFMFAGAWSSNNPADQAILSLLSDNQPYTIVEKNLQALITLNDAPVWSVGTYRGIISKIDLLFAINKAITLKDLETYFDVAHLVLSEEDPSLELPEEDRWAAGIHGKTREITSALRDGISETLVLLAVHGNTLFQKRLGVDVEAMAIKLVRDLLEPLTTHKLESHERDLDTYSEAAPNEFLKILEKDLKRSVPASIGLMRPIQPGLMGRCSRSGLLWALENLAWSPETLLRTSLILAQLAEIKIEDNVVNKPITSLSAIFSSWIPQTAASLDKRIEVMKVLAERFPKIAWKICIEQFEVGHRTGHYSHRPRWRNDAQGFGEVVTRGEMYDFTLQMVEMALNWQHHDRSTIGDLIQRLHGLHDEQQAIVWQLVKEWTEKNATDEDKAWLREKIRVTVMSRRGQIRNGKLKNSQLSNNAKKAYEALKPSDVINKHEWLFREVWVDESANELIADEIDFRKRDERISLQRTEALKEILHERGIKGIFELAEMGKSANIIGSLMTSKVLEKEQSFDFLLEAVLPEKRNESWSKTNLVFGALRGIEEKIRVSILKKLKKSLPEKKYIKLLEMAPFRESTWSLVQKLSSNSQKSYWKNAIPNWEHQTDEELNQLVEYLLEAKRPRAAFACVHFTLEKIRPNLLLKLMSGIASMHEEPDGHYQLQSYDIERAFKLLDKSREFSFEEMAGLEFAYIDVLGGRYGSKEVRGIPNLEKYIAEHPEFYIQAVAWTYKRKDDGGSDPAEFKLDDPALIQSRAERGYKLLESLQQIPGLNKLSEVQIDTLLKWTDAVRNGCKDLAREDVGDLSLGKLFSNAPLGSDGIWPCEPVRHVLEQIQSEKISDGITTGLYNARGVHWRGEGGDQERELEKKYRDWAKALESSYPFISSSILKHLADVYEREAKREDTAAVVRKRLG